MFWEKDKDKIMARFINWADKMEKKNVKEIWREKNREKSDAKWSERKREK